MISLPFFGGTMKKLGIYVHIPFCIKKCLYCDFLSFENMAGPVHEHYINALKNEIEYYSKLYGNEFIVDSIFFGGGTPSLVDAELLKQVLLLIKCSYQVDGNVEVTIECNPKTIDEEKLRIYKEAGFNRVSIGVQTFDDTALKRLGRIHQSQDATDTFLLARQAGFSNVNIDLMFAIPEHSMAVWQESLRQAVCLEPEHISFYSLQLEEDTRYFDMFQRGELDMVSDELDRDMYHYACQFLKASGYNHYEISNCAKPGLECRHNLKYWSMNDYLGLGLGAHSYMKGERFSNTRDMDRYVTELGQDQQKIGRAHERKWLEWQHINSEIDDMAEFIITGMRRAEGICLAEFGKQFGKTLFDAYPEQKKMIEDCVAKGWILLDEQQMKFTVRGVDVSNVVLAEFV